VPNTHMTTSAENSFMNMTIFCYLYKMDIFLNKLN
jgi:hypothetical protein